MKIIPPGLLKDDVEFNAGPVHWEDLSEHYGEIMAISYAQIRDQETREEIFDLVEALIKSRAV